MKRPTMKDVAKAAGVSVMTVSYALRRHPRISAETTARIVKISNDLGYAPHPLVSALISEIRTNRAVKSSPIIAYISSYSQRDTWWNLPLQRAYYDGAVARCHELGFTLELFELSKYGMSGKKLSEVMRYRKVCGQIIGPVPHVGMTLDLDWDFFPSVAFGYSMPSPPIHRVTVNHHQSINLVLSKLTSLGYKRIGAGTSTSVSRRIGGTFLSGMDAYHREIPRSQRIPVLLNIPRSPEKLSEWIHKYKPDVFIDHMPQAYGKLLNQVGIKFPDDIAYVSLSWNTNTPQLAGLSQNSFQVGETAVDVLNQLILSNRKGVPPLQTYTLVNGSWIDGPSAPNKA